MPRGPRNTLIRFPAAAGSLPRRSDFFGSKPRIKAYAAPGQAPTGSEDPETHLALYQPPLNWPRANSLLCVPQVVWLTNDILSTTTRHFVERGSHTVAWDWIHDGQETLCYEDGFQFTYTLGFLSDPPNPYPGPEFTVYDEQRSDEGRAERARLLNEFAAAKATIEALRPDRTYVMTLDFADYEDWGTYYYNGKSASFPTVPTVPGVATPDYSGPCRHPSPIALPPEEDGSGFFGTNFLHLHCGGVVDYFYGFDIASEPLTYAPFIQSSIYLPARARLPVLYPRYAGYRVMLFGPDFEYSIYPEPPILLPPAWPPDVEAGDPTFTFNHDFYTRTVDGVDEVVFDLDINRGLRTLVDIANHPRLYKNSTQAAVLRQVAADLKDYGFTYNGGVSGVTASSIVAAVAAHYGFDPETGRDLPPAG